MRVNTPYIEHLGFMFRQLSLEVIMTRKNIRPPTHVSDTADGQNPAPANIYETLLIMG